MSVQISEERLEELLRLSSPYARGATEAPGLGPERILDDIIQGRRLSAPTITSHRRGRVVAATVAIASVAMIVVGVVSTLSFQPGRDVIAGTPSMPAPSPSLSDVQACDSLARIDWQEQGTEWKQIAVGTPFDGGERAGATGTAHLDTDGKVAGYTVAAGDAPSAIGDRFCIDDVSVLHFNGFWVAGDGKDIAPGDYLSLVPDPSVPNPNL